MFQISPGIQQSDFLKEPAKFIGQDVDFKGVIFKYKAMGNFAFLQVTTLHGILQVIYEGAPLKEGAATHVFGQVRPASIKDPFISSPEIEIVASKIVTLSSPSMPMPFDITKKDLNINNDILFDQRMLSMRHPKQKAIFKIQEGLVQGLRNYFIAHDLTEIRTPKIVKEGAEGGANIFSLDYFGQKAYLAQSPQFYKEFCTGVFERVFEIGPVFRAEKHNTSRHINEYTSIDVEIGNITSFHEIMQFEVGALQAAFKYLKENYAYTARLLKLEIPEVNSIPSMKFSECKELLKTKYNMDFTTEPDLSPGEEQKICEHVKQETGSEFVFITHYPSAKRPFYAMDDVENIEETVSFDLLFRGVEITTGGQRIHDYETIVAKMNRRGMNPINFEFFTQAHKYGLLPHGGFGLGLERLTQKIVGLESVKLATMFPRDIGRLSP